ncbi:hypothetical protein QL285_050545 [Trifolium repens]|nr:hypothetical protein QL285_050545 [Trifolium repens]
MTDDLWSSSQLSSIHEQTGPCSIQFAENRAVVIHYSIGIEPRISAECITLLDTQISAKTVGIYGVEDEGRILPEMENEKGDIFQLHNPIVHLDSVTITSLETKGVNLTANFDLTFMFDTPYYNNMNTSFNDLKVDVWWSGKEKITLAEMDLPPFALAAHNLTTVTSKATVSHEFSNRTDVMNQIVAQRGNGSMEIGVSLFGLISLNDGVSQAMKFNFYPVAVKFPADSKNGTWKWSFTRPIFIFNVL